MTFIPVTEFAFALIVLLLGSITASAAKMIRNLWVTGMLVAAVYMLADTFMVYCLAFILGRGQVRVYNDY
jgi:cell shape-determining protein MreD